MNIYRGDIFYIQNTGYSTGSEQNSGRPAIVVSNDIGNEHAPVVSVVYLTTQEKNQQPTHVKVVCRQESTALCEQIYTISKQRIGDFICTASDEEMRQIDTALAVSLGIEGGSTPSPMNMSSKEIEDMQNCIRERDAYIEQLKHELEEVPGGTTDADTLRISVERELYKNLYEQLLNKLTA
jgi:mRNA interferase MazF